MGFGIADATSTEECGGGISPYLSIVYMVKKFLNPAPFQYIGRGFVAHSRGWPGGRTEQLQATSRTGN